MQRDVDKKQLENFCAQLESQVEHLETELTYLDQLLKKVGFPNGVETIKQTAEELLSEELHPVQNETDDLF